MLGKKGEDKKPSEEDALIQRVDAMMDPKAGQTIPAKPMTPSPAPDTKTQPPPLDIFNETKTAPEIPGKTVKPAKAETKRPKTPKTEASESVLEAAGPAEINEENSRIENADTDKAVDDIVAGESDTILAAEDAANKKNEPSDATKPSSGWKQKLKSILKSKRTWAVIAALLVVLFAVPATRYKILGLAIKRPVTIVVMDSKTATPVSNAEVSLAGKELKTDANGKATINASLGQGTLEITKQYYKSYDQKFFVGFKTAPATKISIKAVGRQVPITVINKITGKPVANAEIQVLKTTAKTDKNGKAVVVLPTTDDNYDASVKAKNYNPAKAKIFVTSKAVKQNSFELTPGGHVYFLSNQSGKIDVVKTNLDGSGRKVVVTGTGKEDVNNTNLLASRDWRYMVLKSKREGLRPALYLIDTKDDTVTQFDGSNAEFNLIGWYGHNFIYDLVSNTVPQSQTGHQAIKSYDAEREQLNQLDQTLTEGNPSSYGYQNFDNFYILNNLLLYSAQWSAYDATGAGFNLAGKNDAIRGVQPSGQAKKDYQTFAAPGIGFIKAALHSPQSVYYAVYSSTINKPAYYEFENQDIASTSNIDQSDIDKTYPTYLISPTSTQTFWSDIRDGKNSLFIGDASAKNPKQIITSSDYVPYGWYSDSYVLVSKNKSQLYIAPAGDSAPNRPPIKITDYYKPAATFNGYGYGYGGL
jgi:hypothetical protein